MNDDQQTPALRLAQQGKVFFVFGINRIRDENGKGIAKNSGCFCERNAVLALIGSRFGVIPLKTKFHTISIAEKQANSLRPVECSPGGFNGGA